MNTTIAVALINPLSTLIGAIAIGYLGAQPVSFAWTEWRI
jgi:hypothetical protein